MRQCNFITGTLNIPNHGGTLQTQPPSMYAYIFREAHGLKHLRTEHTTVAHLDPAVEHGMESKDFQRRLQHFLVSLPRPDDSAYLCVGVISRLEPDFLDAHFIEEDSHEA